MDDAPSEQQSKPAQGALNDNGTSSEQRVDPPGGQQQPSDTEASRQVTSRPENVDTHPESHGRGTPPSAMNMGSMTSTLPDYHRFPMQPQYLPAVHPHGILYPMYPLPPFAHTTPNRTVPFNAQFSQMYVPFPQQHHHHHQSTSLQHGVPGYQLPMWNMNAPNAPLPNQIITYGQGYYPQYFYPAAVGYSQNPPHASLYGGSFHSTQADYDVSKTIIDGSTPMRPAPIRSASAGTDSPHPSSTSGSATTWGPPRKPKQTDHALWVGNLPAGTKVVDLKDHFSQAATKDMQSVFLIPKSNCAFVNYKTEAACAAALARFHDSRFNGVRLVCRLRRGSTSPGKAVVGEDPDDVKNDDNDHKDGEVSEKLPMQSRHLASRPLNRYFIVKSLTVGDLELSRQRGIWATQEHNQDNLNRAFESAPNVYLIFSANKSGEYYGYARMMSPIQEDQGLAMEMPLRSDRTLGEPEELNAIPTQATSTAPTGRIIDDSARGTIFWEADSSEDDGNNNGDGEKGDPQPETSAVEVVEEAEAAESGFQSIGRPFQVQWLSTERVPFHRTRGLRNPWNANREVKIARDGTEIEPTVGERLIQLFHTRPRDHGLPVYQTSLPN